MINNDKWVNSIPNVKKNNENQDSFQIDNDVWINTISKKNNENYTKKYSLVIVFFISSLLLVSVLKNKTRNLEKEINYLKASINSIKFNLNQALLDKEVITSPQNISKLAEEYLNQDFKFYKKSQIKNLNSFNHQGEKVTKKNYSEKLEDFSKSAKNQVVKKIRKKKEEIEKLQELYNNPKSIPGEVKTKVAKQIQKKRFELKSLYESPKEAITLQSISKWGAVQVVKAALGMPVIPGR